MWLFVHDMNEIQFSAGNRTRKARQVALRLSLKYGPPIGSGLYRLVFRTRHGVLKFPLSEAGEFCNDGEASIHHPTLAKGRYLEIEGFVCVMQEWIDTASPAVVRSRLGCIPDWVNSIDCQQVGFDRRGNLKAYDFVHP